MLFRLILGDGTDEFPFIISMSSRALLSVLQQLSCAVVPVVFHMDSTFKCNENEFPVTVLGVSDAQRKFHLLSISVISHRTTVMYKRLLDGLKAIVQTLYPTVALTFQYCMTDCEVAERSVLKIIYNMFCNMLPDL